jgi:hypothetical protein
VIFVVTKKVGKFFFQPLSFVAVLGSGIPDGQKSESGIRDKHPGSATLSDVRKKTDLYQTMNENLPKISKVNLAHRAILM